MVVATRSSIVARIPALKARFPDKESQIERYEGHVRAAAKKDAQIEAQIREFTGSGSGSKEKITGWIQEALCFYAGLDQRLDEIEGVS
jgi:hypothetical protein